MAIDSVHDAWRSPRGVFSREAEKEADEGAIRRLRHANLSSRGLSDFFPGSSGAPTWSRNGFPRSRKRWPGEKRCWTPTTPLRGPSAGELPRQDWQAIKEACSGRRGTEPSEENRLGAGDR